VAESRQLNSVRDAGTSTYRIAAFSDADATAMILQSWHLALTNEGDGAGGGVMLENMTERDAKVVQLQIAKAKMMILDAAILVLQDEVHQMEEKRLKSLCPQEKMKP
jgi:hypothetical protein